MDGGSWLVAHDSKVQRGSCGMVEDIMIYFLSFLSLLSFFLSSFNVIAVQGRRGWSDDGRVEVTEEEGRGTGVVLAGWSVGRFAT